MKRTIHGAAQLRTLPFGVGALLLSILACSSTTTSPLGEGTAAAAAAPTGTMAVTGATTGAVTGAGGVAATTGSGVAGAPVAPTGTPTGGVSTGGTSGVMPSGAAGAATPGAAGAQNAAAGATSVAPTGDDPTAMSGAIVFSVPSQAFHGQLDVGMTTAVANAEIRYTTDGTVPTATSTLYAGTPLALTATTQLRAMPFVNGAVGGAVGTALYVARTFEHTSDLPIVLIEGYAAGKPTDKTVYFDAAVMTFEPVDGVASVANLPTLATRGGYHVRGQSSASFPQAPYKVEFWDNANQDVDYPLLGMPADSDWALIPPYYDRTLIRNPFVYELGAEMGLLAPRNRFAEVYINFEDGPVAADDYQGIYWISETIKNNKARFDLAQLRDETALPEIAGAYIFKFDQAAAEEPLITCTGSELIAGGFFGGGMRPGGMGNGGSGATMDPGTCWRDLEVVDPDPKSADDSAPPVLVAEQKAWLTDYVQQFHDTLHLEPIGDYAQFIDVASFVDYLILNELTFQVDAYVRSAYYHKDRDGLLTAGPLWDYNFALGGVGAQTAVPEGEDGGWRFSPGGRNVNNWYQRLTADPNFMALVNARYAELRQTLLADAAIQARIDGLIAPLTSSVERDFATWPVSDIITSETGFTGGPTAPTWEGQVQVMRDFLTARLGWMDTQLQ